MVQLNTDAVAAQANKNWMLYQENVAKMMNLWLTIPFEQARSAYSSAVQFGLLPKSLTASGDFHKQLADLEKATLGVLARSR